MITIITGTPGSGKTLYTIQKLLQPLVGTSIPQEIDGVTTLHPRTIYTNINGLQLDHELIDGSDNQGLRNWHEWVKPGAVIVFDEVQKVWPPRANGSTVPEDIKGLETHRHMGVDFILITQGPMLIDRNLHMLCGRHLHVRRVANLPFATVYEWDLMSRTLNFKASMRKEAYRYNRAVYKLYTSSSLHTKQTRRLPTVLWFILLALVIVAWKGPLVYESIYGKPKPVATAKPSAAPAAASATPQAQAAAAPAVEHGSTVGVAGADAAPAPKLAGCVRSKSRCSCYDEAGQVFAAEPGHCEASTATPAILLAGGSFPENAVYRPRVEPPPVFDGSVGMPGPIRLEDIARRGLYAR